MTNPFTPDPGGQPPRQPFSPGSVPPAARAPRQATGGAFGQVPGQVPGQQPVGGYTPFGAQPTAGPSPFVAPGVAPAVQRATGLRGRPAGVVVAIVALLVAAGLSIYQLARFVGTVNEKNDQAHQVTDTDPTRVRSTVGNAVVDEVSSTAIAGSVIFTVLAVLCFLTFSWFIWRGAPWTRYASIPLAVFAVIFGVIGGEIIAVAIVALCVLATGCLWISSSVRFASPVEPSVWPNT